MKIVVLDGYTENPGDLSWSGFEGLGEFTVYDRGSETDKEGEAIARIGAAEIVITNKTPITKRVLDSCPSIRYIGVLATGYNVVDYTYAAKQGSVFVIIPRLSWPARPWVSSALDGSVRRWESSQRPLA